MQPSIHHQGPMVGETPNIDRFGQEGMKTLDCYAIQSGERALRGFDKHVPRLTSYVVLVVWRRLTVSIRRDR